DTKCFLFRWGIATYVPSLARRGLTGGPSVVLGVAYRDLTQGEFGTLPADFHAVARESPCSRYDRHPFGDTLRAERPGEALSARGNLVVGVIDHTGVCDGHIRAAALQRPHDHFPSDFLAGEVVAVDRDLADVQAALLGLDGIGHEGTV